MNTDSGLSDTPFRLLCRTLTAVYVACFAAVLPAHAQIVIPPGSVVSVPATGLNLACSNLIVQGTLALGTANVQGADAVDIGSSGTVNGGNGTISLHGNWNNSGQFAAHQSTVIAEDGCGLPATTFTGNTTFFNLIIRSSVGKPFSIPSGATITVLGTLTIQGTAGNPVSLAGSGGGSGGTIRLGPSASMVTSHGSIGSTVTVQRLEAQAIPIMNLPTLILLALAMLFLGKRRLQSLPT